MLISVLSVAQEKVDKGTIFRVHQTGDLATQKDTWRNDNVSITLKRRPNVVSTQLWHYYYVMCPLGDVESAFREIRHTLNQALNEYWHIWAKLNQQTIDTFINTVYGAKMLIKCCSKDVVKGVHFIVYNIIKIHVGQVYLITNLFMNGFVTSIDISTLQ